MHMPSSLSQRCVCYSHSPREVDQLIRLVSVLSSWGTPRTNFLFDLDKRYPDCSTRPSEMQLKSSLALQHFSRTSSGSCRPRWVWDTCDIGVRNLVARLDVGIHTLEPPASTWLLIPRRWVKAGALWLDPFWQSRSGGRYFRESTFSKTAAQTWVHRLILRLLLFELKLPIAISVVKIGICKILPPIICAPN